MSAGRKHEPEVREAIEALYADGYPRLLIFAKLNENGAGPKLRFISNIIADCPKPGIHRCHRCGALAAPGHKPNGICLCGVCEQTALARRKVTRNLKRRKRPPPTPPLPFTHPPCIVCGGAVDRREGDSPSEWKARKLCGSEACQRTANSRAGGQGRKSRQLGRRERPRVAVVAIIDRADESAAIAAFIAARGREAIRVAPAYCAPTAQGCVDDKTAKRRLKRLKLESIPTWRQQRQAQAKAAGLEPRDGE